MNEGLKAGMQHQESMLVEHKHTAAALGSGMLEVFATPAMIAFMEYTSLQLAAKHLDEGESTVGTEVCIRHLRATPAGQKISCTATLIKKEGRSLSFSVIASDDKGVIGEGTHSRFIIDEARFMKKVNS